MVVLEFNMFPVGKGESLSGYVAKSLEIVDQSGLDYECHSLGTTIEGRYDEVMDVVRQCFEAMAAECDRIESVIKLDYRKGQKGRLKSMVSSVEHKLGKVLKK